MNIVQYAMSTLFILYTVLPSSVKAESLNGLWKKTTSPDPNNITIMYHEKNEIKAIGCSEIGGKKVVWHAVGEIEDGHFRLYYHYSIRAVPSGWEQEGIMSLSLSNDGTMINGTARSVSGNWSGPITFKRIRLERIGPPL